MIPWVIALVTLFGWNAIAPDHSRSRKDDWATGIERYKLADNDQIPGRAFNPLVFLAPHPSGGTYSLDLPSMLLRIETRHHQAAFQIREGAIRGRAPPFGG